MGDMEGRIKIISVGDLSFQGSNVDIPSQGLFRDIIPSLAKSDLVIANLEGPLTHEGNPVPGKCTLRGSPGWARVMKEAGINILSLANNHIMDHGESGLVSTMQALESAGINYLGAGRNIEEASAPRFLKVKGRTLAFLARTSVIVSSPSYAEEKTPGVAFFDTEETKERIRICKNQADTLILLMHWGLEEYSYPSPSQRQIAKELIEAGADLILGHHSHVLQGVERVNHGFVAYSLGNFLFDNIQWSFVDQEGQLCERVVELGIENRKAGILAVALSENGVESYDLIPTFIMREGKIILEETVERRKEFELLCSRLGMFQYNLFWKAYSLRQEWLLRVKPLIHGKITWSKLKKVRLKHFKEMANNVRRSSRIIVERTTNPYE